MDVGLVEECAGSDGEVGADRSVSGEVENDLVNGSEGLPRRANFVNVPGGAKLSHAQKRISVAVQVRQENAEGGIPPIAVQASRDSAESRENLGHTLIPGLTLSQFDNR